MPRRCSRVVAAALVLATGLAPAGCATPSIDDEQELIVIDGKTYTGYINFNGLNLSTSAKHWAFEAEKLSNDGDHPVIVVNGKEYLGERLSASSIGDKEFFMWEVKDGTKVTTQVLALP